MSKRSPEEYATVDLTGEWPVIDFGHGATLEFGEHRVISYLEWRAIRPKDKEALRSFLAAKGRVLTTMKQYTRGSGTRVIHLHMPVSKGAYMYHEHGFGYWIHLNDEANRHSDDVSLYVVNCDSVGEAMSRAREWLQDLLSNGVQGITPRRKAEAPKAKLRVVAPKAPRRASA